MIGGPPIFNAPVFPPYQQPYAAPQPYAGQQPYAAPQGVQPQQQPYAGQCPSQPQAWLPQAPATASQPAPAPKSRMQMADETPSTPRFAKLRMPSPSELGLNAARESGLDASWAAAHRRLEQLGATSYRMDRIPQGFRFTCFLPTARVDQAHRVQADASSETEAISLVLDKAEEWAHGAK
jgi:hypothetical protein